MTTARRFAFLALPLLAIALTACESSTTGLDERDLATMAALEGPFELSPAVFDIDATPAGTIVAAENATIKEIRKNGLVELVEVPTIPGVAVNGIEAIGRGNFFATSAGLDQAEGAGLWRVSPGGARQVGDIEAFETEVDPDANVGPGWKDPACEALPGFTAGPQSNPYHLAVLSGSETLIADAAGNTLLHATTDGRIDTVAVFTPPLDEATDDLAVLSGSETLIADAAGNTLLHATTDGRIDTVAVFTPPLDEATDDWRVLFELTDGTPCYVQPVPTSVDVGPEGAYYVGELTGAPATPGMSRIWRIESGSRGVTCPSDACTEVASDLTSILDVEFGPDGFLYVVEMDANGWLAATTGDAIGGTVKRCDVETGVCTTVEDGLELPGAITFDGRGTMWLLESGIVTPTVRAIEP